LENVVIRINFVDVITDGLGRGEIELTSGVYDYFARLEDYQDVSGEVIISGDGVEVLIVMDNYAYAVDYYGENATDLLKKYAYGTEY
jgi:hypothetical protein